MVDADDYLLYRRCPRSLHRKLTGQHLPTLYASDESFPFQSDRAHVVRLARRLFPDGVAAGALSVNDGHDREASPEHGSPVKARVLFDACCGLEPLVACADIYLPQKPEGMAAVLVRESTSIKKAALIEAAFLLWCFRRCDVEPAKIYLYHLEKSYERHGPLDLESLFAVRDITTRARKSLEQEEARIEEFAALLDADPTLERFKDEPCRRAAGCPVCRDDVEPAAHDDLSTLFRAGHLATELRAEGYQSIVDVPEQRLVKPIHRIQRKTLLERGAHVDRDAIDLFLARLEYPLCYLDFEATSAAIPPMDGVSPWEHVPYLYSLHIEREPGAEPEHTAFVMEPGSDQRREMARSLVTALAETGSLVVFSAGFESGVLARLAASVPEYAPELQEATARMVDLLYPFSGFAFYHHMQRGKVSLKTVLPLLTESDYSDEDVQDGYTANVAYRHLTERATADGGLADDERARADEVLEQLVSYCTMDTLAMVQIIARLRALSGGATPRKAP